MEKKPTQTPPWMKCKAPDLTMPEFTLEDFKKHSHIVSPTSAKPNQSSSGKWNCLCSPTTHVGSFRCRHHRAQGGMSRGGSVGSNLSSYGDLSDAAQNNGKNIPPTCRDNIIKPSSNVKRGVFEF